MEDLAREAWPRLAPYLALALLPMVAVAATAFAKALVVTAALRTGLSAERLLPAPVVWILAVLLAGIVMLPVFEGALPALSAGDWQGAGATLAGRWTAFLERNADPAERAFVAELSGRAPTDPAVLVGAFFVTELTEALAMAVAILAPFLTVDLIVAQGLVLLSMAQVPVAVVSLPIKLALFLAADGVHLLVRGFVEGYP